MHQGMENQSHIYSKYVTALLAYTPGVRLLRAFPLASPSACYSLPCGPWLRTSHPSALGKCHLHTATSLGQASLATLTLTALLCSLLSTHHHWAFHMLSG